MTRFHKAPALDALAASAGVGVDTAPQTAAVAIPQVNSPQAGDRSLQGGGETQEDQMALAPEIRQQLRHRGNMHIMTFAQGPSRFDESSGRELAWALGG